MFALLAAWEVWSAFFEPMAAESLVSLDATAVTTLLSLVRDGDVRVGNVVGVTEGHKIVILLACSTAHFAPLALLGAAALVLGRGARLSLSLAGGLVGLAIVLLGLNLTRLTLMAWSADLYHRVHGPSGAIAFDGLTTLLIVAVARSFPVCEGNRA